MRTGLTRPLDQLGRITLPKEMRDFFNWKEDDRFEISMDGDDVILHPIETVTKCKVCGANSYDKKTVTIDGVTICKDCINRMSRMI